MGVPQGSNQGSVPFLSTINDTVKSKRLVKSILFANETSLYFSDCTEFNLSNVMKAGIENACN